jgi:hypothetical protein
MGRKKKTDSDTNLEQISITDISDSEIAHRTAYARMRQLELSNEKEYISIEERKLNICRIDSALNAFDSFLSDFVEMLLSLPDIVQTKIPSTTPEQYADIQSYIDDQIQRLSQKRLYLAIDSTVEEARRATASKNESLKKKAGKK